MKVLSLGRDPRRRENVRDGAFELRSRNGLPLDIRLLLEELPEKPPARALLGHDDGGALALVAGALWPDASLWWHHLDAWVAREVEASLAAQEGASPRICLTPDLPDEADALDLVVLPFPARGEALLSREWIEQAHDALRPGGRLLAGTDGAPTWLQRVVKEIFGRADVQRRGHRQGAVVSARRTREQPRRRSHDHAITVEHAGRNLQILTRPGVFLYGRLDAGTKALLDVLEARPGERVLDLGCGTGVLGIAASAGAGDVELLMVDANARAAAVAGHNAERNDLRHAGAVLRADLEDLPGGPFDLVLANPPYWSRGRIAHSFAAAAARHAPEGRVLMVAKNQSLHHAALDEHFHEVQVSVLGEYAVLTALRARKD